MLKKIKRSFKYFIIVIGVIILFPTVLYLLLQTSEVQTFMVKRITNHFSGKLKSTISIGSIEYKFFNKLYVNDVIIKDKNNDTLLYSKEITVGIRRMDFKNKSFRLGRVSLIDPVISFITDSTGLMNLTWYLDLIRNPSDTTKKGSSRFQIDQIDIRNARFSLINRTALKVKTRIDFNNLNLSGINGIIEDLKILNDTTTFNIYKLGFKESSGFTVRNISSSVILARQNILLNSAFIRCDSSIFNIPKFGMIADSASSYKNFTEKVKLDIQLDKSLINTSDLQYFIPSADSINESVWLSGKIMGTISELRGRNIKLSYRNYTSLDCDFDFSGLPKIENSYLYIGVNSLKTNAKDLEQISKSGKELLVIPEAIKKLGTISFNGSFTGFTTDFVTYGEIRTSQGNIRTDISVRPGESKKYMVKGLLKGSDINIGELTGKTEFLGNLSMQANVDGYAYSLKKFAANLTGKIDSIEINKYIYRNITLNGSFTEKTWDGSINIADRNIKLNLLGLLNFNNKLPEFDFTLNIANANLYKLNFDKLDTSSTVTMLLTSNFKGNNIDNLDGEIKLLNSKFRKYSNNLELYDFSIRTYKENDEPVLSLRTDFVNADIKGYYNFAGLGSLLRSTLGSLMPSQFQVSGKQDNLNKNMFTFEINFKNTDKINNFFRTGISIADKSYIKGAIFTDSIINIGGKADLLTIKNSAFKDFSFNTTVSGSELTLGINSASLSLLGQSELKDFSVGLKTKPDSFIFKVNWDNKDTILNQGSFIARGTVMKNTTGKRNAILKVDIDSSHFYSDNNLWKLTNSSILIDSNAININKLYITSTDRNYLINGSVSENTADTLHLEFKGIDISPLNYWINRKRNNDPGMIPLDFKGRLNGKILLTNVYKSLLLVGNVMVDNFSVLGSGFGNISINSTLDNVKKVVHVEASNNLNSVKTFDVSGTYDPATKKIDLNARATKLPIDFLNPLLKVFASEISGFASGKLNLSGATDNLFLKGAAKVENASMKINYLQTKYSLNDTIRFDKEGIKFNNVRITDVEGNSATLSGSVKHKNFKEYAANLIINITSNGFLVLNTLPKDNQMFYGTAYVSKNDVAKIKSDQNSLSFNISAKTSKSAKTGKISKLFVPISKGLSVSEYSYISFADSSNGKKAEPIEGSMIPPASAKQIGMDLNMNLEVTPDAEIQIIFDAKAGDVMKGHGSSENLNVTLNKKGDFAISGDYLIESGTYNFTLGPIINKPFDVESGGKILFNGNLKDAEIDLKASYLNLKASLSSILPDEPTAERIRVEPQLNLSGKLFNPVVGFDIYLPDADEETRTKLKNAISTQEEMTRQVTALLLINNFIASGNSTTTTATSAMAATSFEMISNQVSNMLSQLSKNVDIGLNIRPGSNAISPQEAELALSTQVLNNKVVLNGNFDVRGTGTAATSSTTQLTNTTNQLTGDFDAEIKLTEKLRFKVFNRFNDTYSTSGLSPYTQGVGIQYKQDFNRFSDLFRKKVKADMKKEDETKIKNKQPEINSP
jgi:hypothetical protein